MDAARLFGRQDLLYIATAGKKGVRPPSNSYRFPNTGHYILRSDWGGPGGEGFEDARYLFLRGGKHGSHGHDDLNAVTMYAYGRPLLIDPGRTTYGTPLMAELGKNRSHNVLLVDDLDMNRHAQPKLNLWYTSCVMDLVDNSYPELYPGVEHRRAVLFARPDYYIVFDRAVSDQAHDFGVNFWLTPPDVTIDENNARVHTNEPLGANVLLQALSARDVAIRHRLGTLDLKGEKRSDIPVVTFQRQKTNEAEFATLLYPFSGKAAPEAISAREFHVENGLGCIIRSPGRTDIVVYRRQDGTAALPGDVFSFDGRVCLARVHDRSFSFIDGKLLKLRGKTMALSENPVRELCVEYRTDEVVVTCPAAEPTLRIAALGRRSALVNGKRLAVVGGVEFFEPFASR